MRSLYEHKSSQFTICLLFFFHVLQDVNLEVRVVEDVVLDLGQDYQYNEIHLNAIDLDETEALSKDNIESKP